MSCKSDISAELSVLTCTVSHFSAFIGGFVVKYYRPLLVDLTCSGHCDIFQGSAG